MLYRFALIIFIGNVTLGTAQSTYNCKKVVQFKQLLDDHHVNPIVWDDAFSEKVVNQLFKLVDPQALFFNKDELQLFVANSKKLDNALLVGNCSCITELTTFYKLALNRAERLIHELEKIPIDFSVKDTLVYNFRGNSFRTTDAMIQNQWLQRVKLSVLNELAASEHNAKLLESKYKPVADKAYKKYFNVIKRKREVPGGIENFLFNKLLNAIGKVYDPHTEFYPATEKQSFLDMLSTDQYSFGFILEDDPMGNVVIGRIIPGSSAWGMKNLHEGDVVTAIASSHMEKIDASLYTCEELEVVLESISKEVELSVRKADGEHVTVKLIKQRIREDDNKIKSLVISNAKNRFGYVNLPIFFSKDELTQTGCAIELAKEIIHLKNAKIQGLILDLRNNGGGNLRESIDLAGIFIDRGALAITKSRNKEAETLKDSNLGTAYDGPLIVMINGASASASELFAAAMRDHNRGILVGESTYGKATGQSILFFDPTHKEMVKITSFRFYDIKGSTHQGSGIVPDIQLPDLLNDLNYTEASQWNALEADRVQKKTYYTALAPLPIDVLRDSSSQRIIMNEFFQNLKKRKQSITTYRYGSEFKVPLSIEGFLHMNASLKNETDNAKPVSDQYVIKLTNFDQHVTGVDNFGEETFRNFIEEVSSDFYIAEVLDILTDFVQLKK